MIFCHKLQDRTEGLSFTKSAPDISGIKRDLCREKRIFLVGLGEKAGDPLLIRAAKGTCCSEEIQSRIACGIECHSTIFSSCKFCSQLCCFSEIHCRFLLSGPVVLFLSVPTITRRKSFVIQPVV